MQRKANKTFLEFFSFSTIDIWTKKFSVMGTVLYSRTLSSTPGFYPLDLSNPLPLSSDNQKCLQILLKAPLLGKIVPVENH